MRHPHRLEPAACRGQQRHFLTIYTDDCCPHFNDPFAVELVWLHFAGAARTECVSVLAYCFMPDHLHAVVQGKTQASSLPRFVRFSKQRTGFHFTRATGRRLWPPSYFDRTLRADDSLASVVSYLVANPVRAGLVDHPLEYPYWGSEIWSRRELLEFVAASRRT